MKWISPISIVLIAVAACITVVFVKALKPTSGGAFVSFAAWLVLPYAIMSAVRMLLGRKGNDVVKSAISSFDPRISVTVAFAATMLACPQLAEAGKIAPIARWAGQAGKVGSGDSGYICSQDGLKEFWRKWEIAKPKPKLDFNRELAVFYFGSGGPHLMNLSLEESGNLVAEYVQTPTVSRKPNYLIFTVPRYGVKSLNGIPVTCSE